MGCGAVSVADTPAIAAGALQRYLAEVPADRALPSAVRAGRRSIRPVPGHADFGTTTVSLDFHFGADGLVSRIYTPARERDLEEPVGRPLAGLFRATKRGTVPHSDLGEVEWLLPEGPQLYWQGRSPSHSSGSRLYSRARRRRRSV
jgi:hypothetical protein